MTSDSSTHCNDPKCGLWLAMGSPIAAEIAGYAGFDFVVIDCEHSLVSNAQVLSIVQAISEMEVYVRLPLSDIAQVQRLLDLPVAGIILPRIETASDAEWIVRKCRYPPFGSRGISSTMTRLCHYGLSRRSDNDADHEVRLFVQIETRRGLDNLDAILAVSGITGVFPGPKDLASDLALNEMSTSVDLQACLTTMEKETLACGLTLMGAASKDRSFEALLQAGYSYVTLGSDTGVLATTLFSSVAEFRNRDAEQK